MPVVVLSEERLDDRVEARHRQQRRLERANAWTREHKRCAAAENPRKMRSQEFGLALAVLGELDLGRPGVLARDRPRRLAVPHDDELHAARIRASGPIYFDLEPREQIQPVSLRSMGDLDWVTISALATAVGTLVLAVATFASVRSANRAARVAEVSLLAGLRPLLMPSRRNDLEQKVGFSDSHWVKVAGGFGSAEATDDAVYLAMSIEKCRRGDRGADGWHFHADLLYTYEQNTAPVLDDFHHLTRDLYIPAQDVGFGRARSANATPSSSKRRTPASARASPSPSISSTATTRADSAASPASR